MRMAGMTETKITDEEALPEPGRTKPAGQAASKQPNVAAPKEVVEHVIELGEATVGDVHCDNPFIVTKKVNVFYGDNHAIQDVTLEIVNSPELRVSTINLWPPPW